MRKFFAASVSCCKYLVLAASVGTVAETCLSADTYPKLSDRPVGSTSPLARAADSVTGQALPAPVVLAYSDLTPVRVKMVNLLPYERAALDSSGKVIARNRDTFLPVDESRDGAGLTPAGDKYPQNRVALHLHGGKSPWVSDGSPHQLVIAAGDRFMNAFDMPYPGDGAQTFSRC
jgi:hypothetical protein